jgi:hypothetical protein
LASNQKIAWDFIDDFFTMTLTSGEYRYYDGLLYFLNYLHLSGNFKIYKPDNVLETALDEQFTYNDGYLMIDNFESKAIGDEYLMRKTDSSPASAIVVANPAVSSEKSLQILPGNYDEQFILKIKANYDVSTVITNSSATKLSYYLLDDMLYMNTNVDKFSVFSMSGSLLLTGTNTSTINIEQLSPGVYIMQVQREGKNHQIKFIKVIKK